MPIRRWLKLARSDRSGRLGSACSMPVLCVLYMLYVDSPVGAGALEVPAPMPAPCMINRSREMIQTGTTMEDQQPLRDISWLGCYPYCYHYY